MRPAATSLPQRSDRMGVLFAAAHASAVDTSRRRPSRAAIGSSLMPCPIRRLLIVYRSKFSNHKCTLSRPLPPPLSSENGFASVERAPPVQGLHEPTSGFSRSVCREPDRVRHLAPVRDLAFKIVHGLCRARGDRVKTNRLRPERHIAHLHSLLDLCGHPK